MRDSSLAHLLSISGIHMMLAGFGFFSALRLALILAPACPNSPATKKWAALAALFVSFIYLILSGASVPTQRAFVTIAISFLAILVDRSALSLRTVALAATAVLLVTPEAWMDPSFQMSFAAVAALVSFHEWWSATSLRFAGPKGIVGAFLTMLAATAITSLIAGLATAPFAAFHFNRLSVYGVAANVLVTPVVSFIIMPAGVLALLLMPFGLQWAPLAAMQKGLELMLDISHWVASWPGATIAIPSFSIAALSLISMGGLWIAIWQAPWRWFGLLPMAAALAAMVFTRPPDVFISNTGGNVAFLSEQGALKFLSARRNRFDAEMWLRTSGDAVDLSSALKDKRAGFDCSAGTCLGKTLAGNWIAVSDGQALSGATCSFADVMIVTRATTNPLCKGTMLSIDQDFITREGAIAIWLDDDHAHWTSVRRERGNRLWSRQTPPLTVASAGPSFSSGGTVPPADPAPSHDRN